MKKKEVIKRLKEHLLENATNGRYRMNRFSCIAFSMGYLKESGYNSIPFSILNFIDDLYVIGCIDE